MSSLTDVQLNDTLIDLLTEISLLTGAILYSEQVMARAQLNIVNTFIRSSYKFMNLTVAELRQAFYLNNQGEYGEVIKHYNKPINGEFIGAVLSSYCKYAYKLNERIPDILARIKPPAAPVIYTPDEAEWRYTVQLDYEYFLRGDTGLIFMPHGKYVYLRSVGLLGFRKRDEYVNLYYRAVNRRRAIAMAKPANSDAQRIAKDKIRSMYDLIESQNLIPITEDRLVKHEMRKMMYLELFEDLQLLHIRNIFTDIVIRKPHTLKRL